MYLRRLALLLLLLMTVTSVTLAQWPESYTVEKQYMVGTIVIFGSLIVLVPMGFACVVAFIYTLFGVLDSFLHRYVRIYINTHFGCALVYAQ